MIAASRIVLCESPTRPSVFAGLQVIVDTGAPTAGGDTRGGEPTLRGGAADLLPQMGTPPSDRSTSGASHLPDGY